MAMEAAMKQMLKPLSPPRHQSGGFNSPFDGMPSGASLDSFPSSGGFDFQQALSQAMQGPGRSTAGPVIDAQVSAQETRSVETAPAASASTPTAAPAPTPPLPPPPSSPPPVKPAFAFEDVRPDPLKERRRAAAAPAAGEDSAASTSAPVEGSSGPARELPSADAVLDMLRNPDLQKMLYPHLPEGMRSPETFELMLKDPTMREQLKKVAEEQIKNFQGASGGRLPPDFPGIDPAAVQKQFSAMGLTPEVFMKKISSDPELSMLMMKPAVMSALVEIQSDPRAMHKYQNNPDIMKIFTKLQVMFPQLGGTAR